MSIKLEEWRPTECGSRLGDIVMTEDGRRALEVKCRRCSRPGKPVYHRFVLVDACADDIA